MDPLERFWSKVDKAGPVPPERPDLGPCWIWTAGLYAEGYGQFWHDGSGVRAHRFAYEALVGPIDAETLDHLCRVRRCVRPDHLEPVSTAENLLRGVGVPARNARKDDCDAGHEFTEENTYRFGPDLRWRACRECKRERDRARVAADPERHRAKSREAMARARQRRRAATGQ